jgi:N-acyl-D-aspartate/D-glutamate deacylase
MRERGVQNEDATPDDIAAMRVLLAEAIAAGAVGFSTSRTIFHRSIGGDAVPGTYATDAELSELVHGMADGGGGVFEAITSQSLGNLAQLGGERFSQDHELRMLAEISRSSGQPITFTTVQHVDDPQAWRAVLDFAVEQNAAGARFRLIEQAGGRPLPDISFEVRDASGRSVWSGLGTEPRVLLMAGRYTVRAEGRGLALERPFEIAAGEDRIIQLTPR